jgi:hypothetical protein
MGSRGFPAQNQRLASDRGPAARSARPGLWALVREGSIYDSADPMSNMFFNMLAVFAEFEADLLKMRTSFSVRGYAAHASTARASYKRLTNLPYDHSNSYAGLMADRVGAGQGDVMVGWRTKPATQPYADLITMPQWPINIRSPVQAGTW